MPTSSAEHVPDAESPHFVEPTTSGNPGTDSANTPHGSPSTAQQSFDDAPPAAARLFGPYRIVAELAHGGMGIVYHVHDNRLGRDVALKALRSGAFARPEEMERFNREAKAVAQLNHPHIVPLYDVGSLDGQLYFTMELARAGSLSSHRPRLQADRRAAVAVLAKVARALEHVHAHGILHRDLKPANILLRDDETPLLSDFGLVKAVGVDADLTRTGTAVGTPSYMAPEQAGVQPERVGPATDIWSLGVIAYELVCGVKPFVNCDERRLIDAIIHQPPTAPRKARPGVDRDLETILLKCLEKDPAQRYTSAATLADDLEAWLSDRPIKARPIGRLRRAARWVRRHTIAAAIVGLLVLATSALPLLRPEPDLAADPAIKALQNELAHRHAVTLIGTTAERPPSRWVGRANFDSAPEDGALQVTTESRALLLLLADPGRGAYRFEGEVRVDSYPHGTAGLFLGYSAQDRADGRLHSQVAVTVHYDPGHAPLEELRPRFILVQFFADSLKRGDEHPAGELLPRRKPDSGWVHIAIDVNDGEDMRASIERDDAAILTRATRIEDASRTLPVRGIVDRVNASVPLFSPRGPLGLFLHRGTFSFRNVKVIRLPIAAGG